MKILKHKSKPFKATKKHIIGRLKTIKKKQYAVLEVSKNGPKRIKINQVGNESLSYPQANRLFIKTASDPKNPADRIVMVKGVKQVTG